MTSKPPTSCPAVPIALVRSSALIDALTRSAPVAGSISTKAAGSMLLIASVMAAMFTTEGRPSTWNSMCKILEKVMPARHRLTMIALKACIALIPVKRLSLPSGLIQFALDHSSCSQTLVVSRAKWSAR